MKNDIDADGIGIIELNHVNKSEDNVLEQDPRRKNQINSVESKKKW